jgi:hypothetical protein
MVLNKYMAHTKIKGISLARVRNGDQVVMECKIHIGLKGIKELKVRQ